MQNKTETCTELSNNQYEVLTKSNGTIVNNQLTRIRKANAKNRSDTQNDMTDIKLLVGEQEFMVERKLLDKSKKIHSMIQINQLEIKLDEDPELFKHILNYIKYDGYVFPKNLRDSLDELMLKYEVGKNLCDFWHLLFLS